MSAVSYKKLALKFFILALCFLYSGNILAQPAADFSATPLTGCAPLLVKFTDLSTGNPTSWAWDFGNGSGSFNQGPSIIYSNPGTYKITLTVKNSNGSNTVVKDQYITVLLNPTVNFIATPALGCLPLSVQFTDQSSAGSGSISTWKWDFGDGFTVSTQNPQHNYTAAGAFDVTLQVKNSFGCVGTTSKSKLIKTGNGVTADFSNSLQSTCGIPGTLNFTNLSTGPPTLQYRWIFGDGGSDTQANPSHTYTTAGNFMVQLIASSSGGCSDTVQKTVTIGTVTPGFTSPSAVCPGIQFSLLNTSSPGPVAALWDFGDGTTSDSLNPVKTYNAPGNYSIKMVANFGACRDSITKTITVSAKQPMAFTANRTAGCITPFQVDFTSNVPGATNYNWDFGDGTTSTQINPQKTYNALGNYDVSLVATNNLGCVDTLAKIMYINIQPATVILPYLPLKNCLPFTYTFTSTINSPDSVLKYNWDFGDGTTDTTATPTHTFTVAGSYAVGLTAITSSGCSATTSVLNGVIVGNKPIANFSASPLVACVNVPVKFTDLSTGNVDEWLWDFGDKTTSTLKNPIHNYQDTGYFNVTLVVRSSGCPDSITFSKYIYVNPPVAKFSIRGNCNLPYEKIFLNTSPGADNFLWDFGDGNTSTSKIPTHVYTDTGTYPVTLIVTNLTTGCQDTLTRNAQVVIEKAMFVADDTGVCKNTMATLRSQNINLSKISNYTWDFGDGSSAITLVDTVDYQYTTSGVFTVKLIITNVLGCKDSLTKPNYINVNNPIANFSSLPGACLNTGVNFIDSSVSDGVHPIIQWTWEYGDNVIDVLNSPPFMHIYTNPGSYNIKLKVSDSNGCADSLVKNNNIIISKPVAGFTTNDTATCPLAPVQFINTSQGPNLTYLWNFGDGTTSSDVNPVHQYLSTNIYSVNLKITDQYGCTDSVQKINYVAVTLPTASFILNDSISNCPPFFATFTNTSSNYSSVLWDFGDGNPLSTLDTPTHFYYIPGTYIVRLRVTGPGGCFDEKFNSIVVKGPKGVLSYTNLTGCNSLTTNFKASAKDNLSFTWDFNDGTAVKTTDSSISHMYIDPGFYLPKLILEDANGCQVPILGIDTIKLFKVNADFSALPAVVCDAGDVSFSDSAISNGIVTDWLWDFGDGSTSTQRNPVHYYASPGLYNVSQVSTTSIGCKDTAIKNGYIQIVSSPDINIQGNAVGCESDSLSFKGIFLRPDTSLVNWRWDFANGQTSLLQDPPLQMFSPPGNYMVTAIATNSSGCKDTATQSITINPLPAVNAGNDTFLCLGSTAQLQASGAGLYQWVLPVNFLSCINCSNPVTNTPDDITYIVMGTNSFGCINFDSINIRVKKPFTITITPVKDSLCIGQGVQLNASAADNYLWTPANGLSNPQVGNPIASPVTNTTYKLVAYDSANCFKDSGFVNLSVFPYPIVNAGPDKTTNTGASVLLSPVYSNDVNIWQWTPSAGLNCNNCPTPVAKPAITTTYTITVKNNGGCSAEDDVTIVTTCTSENIFIPNTFSPNGDGANDIFYPRGTGLNRIRGMKIFNRWGELVFERSNFYANDPLSGWNGLVGGKNVTSDVYTFVIDIICDNNDVVMQHGTITLLK